MPHSCSSSHSNGFFLLKLFATFSPPTKLPFTSPFLFHSFAVLFLPFVRSSFGYSRTWNSVMSQATWGLLEVKKRETDRVSWVPVHTPTRRNSFKHSRVKLSNSQQRASLPPGKTPQREKQRDGMFSPNPPLSFSLSRSCYSLQYFSAVQYKHEEWSKSLRCQKQGTRRTCVEDEMRESGRRTETSIKHSRQWSSSLSGVLADLWAYLEDHRWTVTPPALLSLLGFFVSECSGLFNEEFINMFYYNVTDAQWPPQPCFVL